MIPDRAFRRRSSGSPAVFGASQGKEKGRVNPSFGRKGMQAEASARPGPEGGRIASRIPPGRVVEY